MSRLTVLAAACGLFATSATPPVLAADPAPPASTPIQRLPAVQVDAARVRGVDDFDLPASFTVVSADDDNRRGAQVSELLDGIPGLVARDRQNYAQDTQLSIRGFGARSTFGVRGVRLLVDGIPASMPDGQGQLSHFNVLGAERVEVLRGPFFGVVRQLLRRRAAAVERRRRPKRPVAAACHLWQQRHRRRGHAVARPAGRGALQPGR